MKEPKVQIFDSLGAENEAEYTRRFQQSPEQRMKEFAAIQRRVWGTEWQSRKIEHVVKHELVDW